MIISLTDSGLRAMTGYFNLIKSCIPEQQRVDLLPLQQFDILEVECDINETCSRRLQIIQSSSEFRIYIKR